MIEFRQTTIIGFIYLLASISGSQAITINHLTGQQTEALHHALAERHSRYDEKSFMLRDTLRAVTYRYHTTINEGEVHSTRSSLAYALACMDTGDGHLQKRALNIIRQVLSLQELNPANEYYGVWPYYLEEPVGKMSPPDRNWADFLSVTLLQVLFDHKDLLSEPLLADINRALAAATTSIRKRDVGPGYTNIAIMGTFVCLAAGKHLNDTDLYDYGLHRLNRFHDYTLENDKAFTEFNSPTYTLVALIELGRMRMYIDDPQACPQIDDIYRWAWEEIALHFHAPTHQWAGPHSRSYRTLLRDDVLALIQRATESRVDFGVEPDVDINHAGYRVALPCPEDLMHNFMRLDHSRTFSRDLSKSDVKITTFLHPDYCLGSIDHSMLWNQRRALLAYWGDSKSPSYMHLRFMHDDYDFSAARITTIQKEGKVLAGINIATDGGDRHPSLDRIKNAIIQAKSLRIRLEFGGKLPEISLPDSINTPVVLDLGNTEMFIRAGYAALDGYIPHWQTGTDDKTAWLDLILFQGDQEIDLSTLEQAVAGLAISFGKTRPLSSLETARYNDKLQMRWGDLRLWVPVKPASRKNLAQSFQSSLHASKNPKDQIFDPVNPKSSQAAQRLLNYLYKIKGKSILAGQHNYPGTISESTEQAFEMTGTYPLVWGQDFGFTATGKDGIDSRPAMIREAIDKYQEGFIITLMWHAVRPIDDEPNGWKESVQNELTDEQWQELVTIGSPLYRRWLAQLDTVAEGLKFLRDENVPVLWRPYHEMNGGWFWWGHKKGDQGFRALWRNMYDYFTHHHGLNNLIWVWNPNAPRGNAGPYVDYFPGHDVVDVLAADIYSGDYKQSHHDDLLELAQGKPIAIGECGQLPDPHILDEQSQWSWFMCWAGFLKKRNTPERVLQLYQDPRVLTLDEISWQ